MTRHNFIEEITQHFNNEVAGFNRIEIVGLRRVTPIQKHINRLKVREYNKKWREDHKNDPDYIQQRDKKLALLRNRSGDREVSGYNGRCVNKSTINRQTITEMKYEFFMEHGDEVLSATGKDLDSLVRQFDIDDELPTDEKQEQVYVKMAKSYLPNDTAWTPEQIARTKARFLDTLEKVHFVKLACKTLHIKEAIIRAWRKTDPEFEEEIHSAQVRMAQKIAHALLANAMEGDLGAQMYALKQFGNAVNFIEPTVESAVSQSSSQIANLSLEEQETLLGLLRKAQNGSDNNQPTVFIESDEDVVDGKMLLEDKSQNIDITIDMINESKKANIIDYQGD